MINLQLAFDKLDDVMAARVCRDGKPFAEELFHEDSLHGPKYTGYVHDAMGLRLLITPENLLILEPKDGALSMEDSHEVPRAGFTTYIITVRHHEDKTLPSVWAPYHINEDGGFVIDCPGCGRKGDDRIAHGMMVSCPHCGIVRTVPEFIKMFELKHNIPAMVMDEILSNLFIGLPR